MALAFAAAPATAARSDFTDLWWNPAEPGWGVNLVQAQTFMFATFFVYGPGNQPVWYTGEMTRDATGAYAGPLYVTTGTAFGAPANPAHKSARQVGDVTFTPSAATMGTLGYTVDGIVVSKLVQRQTLQTIPLGDSFIGGMVSQWSGCTDPTANTSIRRNLNLRVKQVAADKQARTRLRPQRHRVQADRHLRAAGPALHDAGRHVLLLQRTEQQGRRERTARDRHGHRRSLDAPRWAAAAPNRSPSAPCWRCDVGPFEDRGGVDAGWSRPRRHLASAWISAAARSPDSIAPWIHACCSDACSPAKWMRPSGAMMCSYSSVCWLGSNSANAPPA